MSGFVVFSLDLRWAYLWVFMGQRRLDEMDLYMDMWDFAFLLHACMVYSVLVFVCFGGQLGLLEVIRKAARNVGLARPYRK